MTDLLPSIATSLETGEFIPRGAAWPALAHSDFELRTGPWLFPRVRGRTYAVATAGSVVELRSTFFGESKRPGGAQRGCVAGFSKQSRRRLFKTCSALPWEVFGQSLFVTLTYPEAFPTDGRTVKRHLNAFRSAWCRQYGKPQAMWKLEFQGRGAPHFHLAIVMNGDVEACKVWMSNTWYRIVSSGDPKHLRAGTNVQIARTNLGSYFAGYIGKSRGSKEWQNKVPEGFDNVGRMWGIWGMRPQWQVDNLSAHEWVQLRRMLYGLQRSQAKREGRKFKRRCGRVQGEWRRYDGVSGTLLVERLRSVRC